MLVYLGNHLVYSYLVNLLTKGVRNAMRPYHSSNFSAWTTTYYLLPSSHPAWHYSLLTTHYYLLLPSSPCSFLTETTKIQQFFSTFAYCTVKEKRKKDSVVAYTP